MFNFETVVGLIMANLLLLSAGYAQNNSNNNVMADCSGYLKEWRDTSDKAAKATDQADKTRLEDQAAQFLEAHKTCQSSNIKNGTACNNADDNFYKALETFSTACGDANMGGDCAAEVAKCKKTKRNGVRDENNTRDPNKPYDVNGVAKQCPAAAGRDIDKLEKEVKDYKEKIQKLEKEMPDLRDKINQKKSKLNEKQHDLQKDVTEKQSKLTEDLQKLSEDKDAQEKAITDQVTGIAAQIAKAQDALSQISVTKMEGQLKLKQAKVQADLNCHAQATAQMSKMQNDVADAMSKGTFSGGGFSKAMSRVGLSDRQHWQRLAQKYYQWCLDSKPTKDTKEGANDGYRLLLTQSRQSEISINKQIEQLKQQQAQLVGGACTGQTQIQTNGTNGGETQMCQSVRKSMEKANNLRQKFNEEQNNAKQKYMQLAQEGQDEMSTMQQNYYEKMREIENEKSRLDNAQKYLQAKYDRSGGSTNIDSKGLGKATALLTGVQASANKLLSCDRDFKKKLKAGETPPECANCDLATKFIEDTQDSPYSSGRVRERAASAPDGGSEDAIPDSDIFSNSSQPAKSSTGRTRTGR